jgi:hypothetical protein
MFPICDDEMECMWMKAVVEYFKVLSQDLSGGAEKKHETPQSGQSVSGPGYEPARLSQRAFVSTSCLTTPD